MKKFIVAVAMAGLAFSGMAGVASAQHYPYPNQGYPNQYQRYPEHRRHHRNSGYNGQQQCDTGGYGYGGYTNGGVCSAIRGTIVAVNGNQVTLRVDGRGNGYGNGGYNNGGYNNNDNDDNDDNGGYNNGGYDNRRQVTIDDQPALDNRTSGRVSVGRYLTAYGYWQNGVFYATSMN